MRILFWVFVFSLCFWAVALSARLYKGVRSQVLRVLPMPTNSGMILTAGRDGKPKWIADSQWSHKTNMPPGFYLETNDTHWAVRWGRPGTLIEIGIDHLPMTTRRQAVIRAWEQWDYHTNEPSRLKAFKPAE